MGLLFLVHMVRNSDLFAAGVDIHGVHDRTTRVGSFMYPDGYEMAPDREKARQIALMPYTGPTHL